MLPYITLAQGPPNCVPTTIIINLDQYQDETYWTIEDTSGNNNIGIFINDYVIKYNTTTLEPKASKSTNMSRVIIIIIEINPHFFLDEIFHIPPTMRIFLVVIWIFT